MDEQISTTTPEVESPKPEDGWEWAVVEIMGFRKHAGRIREEERFGVKMMRLDVPIDGDPATKGWRTYWYGGASVFSFALTDEASVMRANNDSPYRLLAPADEPEIDLGPETPDETELADNDSGEPDL